MANRKILVPVDGEGFSYSIFPRLVELFDGATSEVVILHVGERVSGHIGSPKRPVTSDGAVIAYDEPRDIESASHPIYASQERESAMADFRASAQKAAEVLQAAGFTVSYDLRSGNVTHELLHYLESNKVDLVAMVTHWRTGLDRVFHGSTLNSLLPQVEVPILILRHEDDN